MLSTHRQILNRSWFLTAQHREMLDQMLKWFQVKPDYDLDLMRHKQTLCELTSRVILAMEKLLCDVKPDLLLVQRRHDHSHVGPPWGPLSIIKFPSAML